MISVYSVITSVLFYNLSLAVVFVLRRKTKFLAQYTISTLLFLTLLSAIRLFSPVDHEWAYIVRSEWLLPKVFGFFRYKPDFMPWPLGSFLLIVWGIGTAFYVIRDIKIELKAYKARKKYPCIKSEQVQRVSAAFDRQYDIRVSPLVSQPYTVGIIKPVIYLPDIELTDEELYFVLIHEIQHIKSHDNLKRLFFLVIEAVFWWNPLAHISVNEFEMLVEIQCDSKVSADMDSDTLKSYLQSIITVMKQISTAADKSNEKLATSFAQTYSIKQRFEVLLLRKSRKSEHMRYLLCALFVVVFGLSYFIIFQPYHSAPVSNDGGKYYAVSANDSFILIDGESSLLIQNGKIVRRSDRT